MFYVKTKVENHHIIKPLILQYIEEQTSVRDRATSKIYKTDWNDVRYNMFSGNALPKYMYYLMPIINGALLENFSKMGAKKINIINSWFQQYVEGDTHEWHNHPSCHFSNVYFLEAPPDAPRTEFITETGETLTIDVQEGEILSFPAYYNHRSPVVSSNTRKTVVVFNTDISCER